MCLLMGMETSSSALHVSVDGHGDIVFGTALKTINAHCLYPHLDVGLLDKCRMDRSVPPFDGDTRYRVKGRPIGLLMAEAQVEHSLMKAELWKPASYEDRRCTQRVVGDATSKPGCS
jgi:hypothetical protein